MKKILTLLLAAVLMFSCLAFVACTDNKTEPTAAPTETPTEAPTDAPAEESGLDAAAEYVRQLYKDMTATGADYTVISSVKVGGVTYSVTWAVSVDSITLTATEDGKILVDLPDDGEEEIPYVLTATIADAEGNKVTKEFNLTVVFNPVKWSEYYAAETGDFIIVEGIVTGMVSKSLNGASNNCLFLQDADEKGGYYVYGMADDPAELGIEIGMTVRVSGTKDIYSGTHEVKPNGVKIVSKEKTPVTPIDITKAYTDAENLKDKGLVDLQGALVTIKGVEITGQVESSGYYQFTLAGKESYIRISSSTCAITKAEQSTFKSTHTEKRGYLADATGIVSVYNGAIYLVPVTVDALNNFQMVERTDAEKLVYEAGNISVDSVIHMNTTLNLPTAGGTYSDVAISWASDNACAVVDGGVVTITLQDEAQTVKLTATLTIGTETKTVEFTVAVDARPSIIPQIVDTPVAGTAYKFMLTQSNLGINLFINGEMNNFCFATTSDYTQAIDVFVEVVDGGYKLYTMVGKDKTYICVSPSADGAHVNVTYDATKSTVYTWNTELKTFTTEITGTESKDGTYYMGTYGTYNTFSASLISKADTSFVAHLVEMVDAASCVHTYAGDCDATCDLCGASREVAADHTYDNDCDAKCNVCNAERTPADHVYDNACDVNCNVCGATRKVQHTDAEGDGKCDVCGVNMADTVINYGTLEAPITTTQAVKFNETLAAGDVSEQKFYVQGVITQIGEKGNYYKNVYITDGETEFLIYSINLMEDMTSMKVGDTITAHGFIKNYNGTIEMASNGGEYVYVVAFVESVCEHTYSGDCDATCDKCGATREVEHVYDNACDTECNDCGATRSIQHVDEDMNDICDVCEADLSKFKQTIVTAPEAGKAYKLGFNQGALNQILYITGKMSGYYGATVDAPANGIDVYVEVVDGGYKLYFNDGNDKLYIAIEVGEYINVKYLAEGSVFTFDTTYNTFIYTEGNASYFMGTKDSHTTLGGYAVTDNLGASTYYAAVLYSVSCSHEYTADCDIECNLCGASREAAAHTYDNHKDADCNVCGAARTPLTCVDENSDGTCDLCGDAYTAPSNQLLATFEFGENGDATHEDGQGLNEVNYTESGYTLQFTSMTKVYGPAFDATGNSCIKLGNSSTPGSFSFTVADNVNSVVIKIAKYKTYDTTVTINGVDYVLTKNSNDGEYDEIVIDTSSNKTVNLAAVSGKGRCMIDSITFVG